MHDIKQKTDMKANDNQIDLENIIPLVYQQMIGNSGKIKNLFKSKIVQ